MGKEGAHGKYQGKFKGGGLGPMKQLPVTLSLDPSSLHFEAGQRILARYGA